MKSSVALVVVFLLIISFAFWGVDGFLGQGGQAVGRIGDKTVSQQDFFAEFDRELNNARIESQQSISTAQAREAGLDQLVLQRMINFLAIDQTAATLGVEASDAMILTQLQASEGFVNPVTGRFDRTYYESRVRQLGYTVPEFTTRLRSDLTRGMFMESLAGPFTTPDILAATLYQRQNETRSVDYLIISPAVAGDPPAPTDDELRDFHLSNENLFSTPEYRRAIVVTVRPEDFADDFEISEDDLRAEYEFRSANYTTPERRTIRLLTYPSEIAAGEAAERLRGGASFAALATERGVSIDQATQTDVTPSDLIDADVATAAFDAPETGVAGPIESAFGWTIAEIVSITPGESQSFEDVRDELRATRINDLAADRVYDVTGSIENQRDEGAPWAEAARSAEVEPRIIEAVDRFGRGRDGLPVAGLSDVVLQEIFALGVGQEMDQFEDFDQQNAFYAVAVEETYPEEVLPFDEIRNDVMRAWRADWTRNRIEDISGSVIASLDNGVTLQGAAFANGATALSTTVSRSEDGQVFAPGVLAQIFETQMNGVARGSTRLGDSSVIAVVTAIHIPDAPSPVETAGLKRFLGQSMQQELVAGYVMALREDLNWSVNEQNLNAVFAADAF